MSSTSAPNIFYIDGDFMPADESTISVTDLAVLRGYGVFDFLRTYGGKPFHLDEHLQRLRRSATLIDLEVPWSHEELKAIVAETLSRNDHAESNVRIVITGGASDDFITPKDQPRLLVLVTPAMRSPEHYYIEGAKVITFETERYLPGAKTLNYIPAIRAMKRARAVGAIEAIYVNRLGNALEGTTTNLFAFFGETLVTPGDGILWGITRGTVLELAKSAYPIEMRDLPLAELLTADEVFITSSNKQIMPIVQIDDHRIGRGLPGAHTGRLMEMFNAFVGSPVNV
jgi:branched-chain amino acid aminotransferase